MYLQKPFILRHVGFVSSRFKGADGVSLETTKWRRTLERMGYECFFFSGLSDWDSEKSMVVEEAYLGHPLIEDIQHRCFGTAIRDEDLTREIYSVQLALRRALYNFVSYFEIDLLIVENALTMPTHIPLGLALTEFIAETSMPVIAHHHDFSWGKQPYSVNCVEDYLSMAFPPRLPTISHVVINTEAQRQLAYRCGISSIVIPNVFDFDAQAPEMDDYSRGLRDALGVQSDEVLLFQPTQIIPHKGIEHAIELTSHLKDKKAKLLISHLEQKIGSEYHSRVLDYAKLLEVEVLIRPDIIDAERGFSEWGTKKYSLWDCFLNADFITFPSEYEGFGNAFLEAVWFKRPILVNRYSVYQQDIEPFKFEVVSMDTFLTPDTVDAVRSFLNNPKATSVLCQHNFDLGRRYFSLALLEQRLKQTLSHFAPLYAQE